jgi:hypothetical protein
MGGFVKLPTAWADIGAEKGEGGLKSWVDTAEGDAELKNPNLESSRKISVHAKFKMISQHVHREGGGLTHSHAHQ